MRQAIPITIVGSITPSSAMFGGLVSAPTVTFQAILHSELVEPVFPSTGMCQYCKAFTSYILERPDYSLPIKESGK